MAIYLGSNEASLYAGQPLMIIPDDSITTSMVQDGAITDAKLASSAVSAIYTITLGTTWNGTTAPYSKTQTVNGILATDYPIVDLVPASTFATAEAQEEAWANIYRITTSANALTFYAKEKPTVAMQIKILCIRK